MNMICIQCQLFFAVIYSTLLSVLVQAANVCDDVMPNCRSYGQAVCVDYAEWAKINCAFTCKFCTGTPPPKPCQDYNDDCAKYASDLCTSASYKGWAQDNCSKFCGFCIDSTSSPATTTAKQTTPQTTQSPRPCADGLNFCLLYSKKACDDVNWADKYCKKTCARC